MTPEALRDEIRDDPAGLGYAVFVPRAPGRIAELMNEPATMSMFAPRFVTARTVLAECGAVGALALSAMERFSQTSIVEGEPIEMTGLRASVYWAMKFVTGSEGIDVGHPQTAQMLDALVLVGVLTDDMAAAIKGMAIQPCSRYALLAGHINARVEERDVRAAIALMQG